MEFRTTDDPADMLWILGQLKERLPQLSENDLFFRSIQRFVLGGDFKFFIVEDTATSSVWAFGLLKLYKMPWQEQSVLALEAAWFRDETLEAQIPVWKAIASIAQKVDLNGVCIAQKSVNTPDILEKLAELGHLGEFPVGRETDVCLQGAEEGVYSAFTDKPDWRAFFTDCVRIYTRVGVYLQELVKDFRGAVNSDLGTFYRGEGRLKLPPYWDCDSEEELIGYIFNNGFCARSEGRFSGALQEQILQQGYVNQATVSLSASFDVSAYYATHKHEKRGVVFTIDAERLCRQGNVYDSFETMTSSCDWIMESEFETLVNLVEVLGVLRAGQFLNDCYEETEALVGSYQGINRPSHVWARYFDEGELDAIGDASIEEESLDSLYNTFETFWMFALGQVGSIDTIMLDGSDALASTKSKPVNPFLAYYWAFRGVEGQLKAALEAARGRFPAEYGRHPGWDLTPFGYIAKTCRDQEFFSTGPVLGNCITEATIVSADGTRLGTQSNQERTGAYG